MLIIKSYGSESIIKYKKSRINYYEYKWCKIYNCQLKLQLVNFTPLFNTFFISLPQDM